MGKYPVTFKFIAKYGEENICKPWIIVTPVSHKIDVGKDFLVDIQVLVDKESAWAFHNGTDKVILKF